MFVVFIIKFWLSSAKDAREKVKALYNDGSSKKRKSCAAPRKDSRVKKLSFASELFTYLSSFIAALFVSSPSLDTENSSGELAQTEWEIIE